MVTAEKMIMLELRNCEPLKMFVAAASRELFEKHYPEHMKYYQQYRMGQSKITKVIKSKLPDTLVLKFKGKAATGLGRTIAAFLKLATANEQKRTMEEYYMLDQTLGFSMERPRGRYDTIYLFVN